MQRFKNILVILNPESIGTVALDKAVKLARQNEARLTLFSVVEVHQDLHRYPESVVDYLIAPIMSRQRECLRDLMKPLLAGGIDVVSKVVDGIAFLEIIRQVMREEHDLVITTAEEKKVIHTRLLGATSMHLMRKCPCPVWVVKRVQTRPYARILAAVDPLVDETEHDSLNPLILQLAADMAREGNGELHIVHAWHLYGERYVHILGWTEEEIKKAKRKEMEQHKKHLDALLAQVDIADLKPRLHLVEGHPDECIPELIMAQGIDLLVMGTVCRTGIAGFLIGNTAEEVLNQVDCSVLTVKPEGFETPVTLSSIGSLNADD
jgi:nucleotide-binding universal stress UspA family protein